MKNIIIAFIFILVLGGVGIVAMKYLSRPAPTVQTTESKTSTVSGKLMPGKGDDYSFVLLTDSGRTIGIASQQIQLDQYVNKTVEITGSYSGTTLYAYTVTEK